MPLPFLTDYRAPATHALVVTSLKHHYLIKSGEVRYQQTKRDLNAKRGQCIRLYLLCDLWTGAAFGELDPLEWPINILGFLTRAWWHAKPWTCFSGIPDKLIISQQLRKDPAIADQLHVLEHRLGITSFPPPAFPPWYSSTVRRFEEEISSVQWHWQFECSRKEESSTPEKSLSLDELGALATISFTDRFRHLWRTSESRRPNNAIPEAWLDYADGCHEPYAGWRQRLHLDWPETRPLNESDPFCLY